MTIWMLFSMVCFAGMGFMFFCILRRQDALLKAMRSDHEQFKVLLRAMASRMDTEPEALLKETMKPENTFAGHLHLSVDEALDAYSRKESRGRDKDAPGMPDLKF